MTFRADYGTKCPPDPKEGGLSPGPFTVPCHSGGGAVFTGPPLRADTEVTGHPVADLWVSADREDANVFAYLRLNPPQWKIVGLPWHRSYAEDAEPLAPGIPARLSFDLLPISYVFKQGHRLQVTITGSDPRERDRLPGPPPTLTVHGSGPQASRITLPVVGS
jgi:uncharacterized protein